MRTDDLSGGSLKALLLLLLVAANIIAALPNERAWLQSRWSAQASRAAFGASPNARSASDAKDQEKFPTGAPETAGEARALLGQPPH